jgi:hypothetical protein
LPDSVPIPLDVLAETQAALDAALRLTFACGAQNYDAENAARQVRKAKAKLAQALNEKSVETPQKSDTIQGRSEALERKVRNIAAMAEDVARQLKELKAA